jgi:prolyl-tRNA editing enzyme YbaK/EbsC (Cys-tRNA(Pro) deacylase)
MNALNELKAYIETNHINCKHLIFDQPTHSVQQAADATGTTPEDFVKNICLKAGDGTMIVAIVKGEDRASTKRVAKALEIDRPEIASPDEILDWTGYAIGGVPSFGYSATFLIDEKVMEMEVLYTGGGTDHSLVRISPEELIKANNGSIKRIRK